MLRHLYLPSPSLYTHVNIIIIVAIIVVTSHPLHVLIYLLCLLTTIHVLTTTGISSISTSYSRHCSIILIPLLSSERRDRPLFQILRLPHPIRGTRISRSLHPTIPCISMLVPCQKTIEAFDFSGTSSRLEDNQPDLLLRSSYNIIPNCRHT